MTYKNMVKALDSMQETDKNGAVIKYIPDMKKENNGVMDPRTKADRIPLMEDMKNNPPVDWGDLKLLRDMMGWPNQDVTDGSIQIQHKIVEGTHGEIPVRIYTPQKEGLKPCTVYFHGGGFYGGTVECVENPCKCLAWHANSVVVSVDYRLAPEHPFPKGFDDCFDVIKDIYNKAEEYGVLKNEISVAGDSAGGNLAAACSLRDRNEGQQMVKCTALLYPSLDMGCNGKNRYQWSLDEYDIGEEKELLEEAIMEIGNEDGMNAVISMYLGGDRNLAKNEYVSPLLASSGKNFPPTILLLAEYDYLTLEGEAYAKFLREWNVPVKVIKYRGLDHAFIDKIGQYPQAENAIKEIAGFLTR